MHRALARGRHVLGADRCAEWPAAHDWDTESMSLHHMYSSAPRAVHTTPCTAMTCARVWCPHMIATLYSACRTSATKCNARSTSHHRSIPSGPSSNARDSQRWCSWTCVRGSQVDELPQYFDGAGVQYDESRSTRHPAHIHPGWCDDGASGERFGTLTPPATRVCADDRHWTVQLVLDREVHIAEADRRRVHYAGHDGATE
jgi:hypothetical protein